MKIYRFVLISALAIFGLAHAQSFKPAEFLRVSCGSEDGGNTCFGYGELYPDGTSDACGRIPNGPDFAMKMTYTVSRSEICETVVSSSHPEVMPVGETLCYTYLQRKPNEFTYRYPTDGKEVVRHSYHAKRSDKWCQHLIDAL